ncbi:hypothetical protein [Streptomyces sp. NPDC002845]
MIGGLVAVGWLVSAVAAASGGGTEEVAATRQGVPAPLEATEHESAAWDLVPPVVAVVAVAVLVAYAYLRRRRRATTRTTPGGSVAPPPVAPLPELDRQGRRLLVEVDDRIRAGYEELGFVVGRLGDRAGEPFAAALQSARDQLAVAFQLRQQLDDSAPGAVSPDTERGLLEEIVARCTTAGRGLGTAAAEFARVRALERDVAPALGYAETRFRELTGRVAATDATLTRLRQEYAPSATASVIGHVEQAKDRLLSAAVRLNQAHQSADSGDNTTAAAQLRAAESAVSRADALLTAVDRLAAELAGAEGSRPPVRGTEAAEAAETAETAEAEGSLSPALDTEATEAGEGREDREAAQAAQAARSLPPVRGTVAAAAGFVTAHREVVGSEARTRLAEAERHLARAREDEEQDQDAQEHRETPEDTARADALAREALRLAEQDVQGVRDVRGEVG